VRDRDGSIVYEPTDDTGAHHRVQMRRLKMNLLQMMMNVNMNLQFMPKLPDGQPYLWGKKQQQAGLTLDPDAIKREAKALLDRMIELERPDDILEDPNEQQPE
jgi:hypothetical protein